MNMQGAGAIVTYRAIAERGQEVAISLQLDPAAATAAEGYQRLSARYPGIDPLTLEIEIREAAGAAERQMVRARRL